MVSIIFVVVLRHYYCLPLLLLLLQYARSRTCRTASATKCSTGHATVESGPYFTIIGAQKRHDSLFRYLSQHRRCRCQRRRR